MSDYLNMTYRLIKTLQGANLEEVANKFTNAIAIGKSKVPKGKEVGANNLFVNGGQTVGKINEGVINGIPKAKSGVTTKVIKIINPE